MRLQEFTLADWVYTFTALTSSTDSSLLFSPLNAVSSWLTTLTYCGVSICFSNFLASQFAFIRAAHRLPQHPLQPPHFSRFTAPHNEQPNTAAKQTNAGNPH